jgi:hypothetical protein
MPRAPRGSEEREQSGRGAVQNVGARGALGLSVIAERHLTILWIACSPTPQTQRRYGQE